MPRIPSIPEKLEIKKLPHWARVALAARCARRLQPLIGKVWTNVSQEDIETIESAISATEIAAENAQTIEDSEELVDDILCVLKNFTSYTKSQKVRRENHPGYYCIQVVFCSMKSVDKTNADSQAWEACECCEMIGDLCYGQSFRDNLLRHIFWDFQRLNTKVSWCNSTPVPQGFFSPLWDPGKEPDWDKVASDMKQKIKDS